MSNVSAEYNSFSQNKYDQNLGMSKSATEIIQPPTVQTNNSSSTGISGPKPCPFGDELKNTLNENLLNNPEKTKHILSSPMMMNLLRNPTTFRTMLENCPQFQAALANNPCLARMMQNPEALLNLLQQQGYTTSPSTETANSAVAAAPTPDTFKSVNNVDNDRVEDVYVESTGEEEQDLSEVYSPPVSPQNSESSSPETIPSSMDSDSQSSKQPKPCLRFVYKQPSEGSSKRSSFKSYSGGRFQNFYSTSSTCSEAKATSSCYRSAHRGGRNPVEALLTSLREGTASHAQMLSEVVQLFPTLREVLTCPILKEMSLQAICKLRRKLGCPQEQEHAQEVVGKESATVSESQSPENPCVFRRFGSSIFSSSSAAVNGAKDLCELLSQLSVSIKSSSSPPSASSSSSASAGSSSRSSSNKRQAAQQMPCPLLQLRLMGFLDDEENLRALRLTGGDVNSAVPLLLHGLQLASDESDSGLTSKSTSVTSGGNFSNNSSIDARRWNEDSTLQASPTPPKCTGWPTDFKLFRSATVNRPLNEETALNLSAITPAVIAEGGSVDVNAAELLLAAEKGIKRVRTD